MLTKSSSELCQCRQCLRDRSEGTEIALGVFVPAEAQMMVLCPVCGNKRCPRATNHRFACTGSNEPGQIPDETQAEVVAQGLVLRTAPADELQHMRNFLASKGLAGEYAVYRMEALRKEQADQKSEATQRLLKLSELGVVFIKESADPEFWSWRHTTASAFRYRTRGAAIAGAWGALHHLVK